jgi:PKHD-type hydroxylase
MNDETRFIFDRLAFVARSLNGKFFNFDLHGFSEPIQYTVYEGTDNHHYTWHMDKGGSGGMPQRKLSMVVQLSHPHDYEGGELEILESAVPTAVNKERGIIHAFPGYILHRVTPVTAGVRKTLVVWVGGTPFR